MTIHRQPAITRLLLLMVVWLSVATAVVPATAQTTALDPRTVYERAAPAIGVVRIMVDGRSGAGTAFVIDRAGLMLTAAHVARRADTLVVELPGTRPLPASVIGYDARRDVALLRVNSPAPLPAIDVADGTPRAGEPIVVIGAPRGRPGVMTAGEVVATRASLPGLVPDTLIVINADVAPGNSGGPVLNASGQAVGLVIARGNDSVGLAVSGGTILAALPGLRQGARIERPWIGIAGRTASPEFARERGLSVDQGGVILEIVPESPAAAADLQPGDVIVVIDGRAIASWQDVLSSVAGREPGQRVRLTVVRGSARLDAHVTLGVRP